ncbi:MAG: S8 family serine peptidase [Fimbriimonadales bacterium]
MRFAKGFSAIVMVIVAIQLGVAQLEAVDEPTPSLDPLQIPVPFVPDELVVGLEQGGFALPVLAMEMVGTIASYNPPISAYVVRLAPGIAMESAGEFLRALPGVRYVEPNYLAFAFATPNDPGYGQQYGLTRIQANLAWDIWQPQRTVYIAIIDTGIDSNHPDLKNKMRRHANGAVYGYNPLNNTTNALDDNGHGTHCAGIAAAEINNGIGIAGVAAWNPVVSNSHSYVQLMPVKVLSSSGSGSLDAVARGITWAADNGAHILSLSLGAGTGAQQLQDAVNYAWNRGCLVVAAAGNDGSSSPQYPAYYTNSIAVAATDSTDTLASFSQYGSWVDIAAPGVNILSTYPSNSYQSLSGTSMACPHVAGAAAVLWSHNAILTNAQLRNALETHVDPYQPYAGRTIGSGKGRLNVYRALQAVGGGGPTQPSLHTLSLNPTSVVGGTSSTGTVTLTAAAPSGGFVVNLSSSHPSVASVPSSVTVPAGATSANFTVSTSTVSSSTNVTITASAGGVARTATLTVNPASTTVTLQSLTISPTSVWGGSTATGTVRLSGPAPAGGAVVQLRSSSARASVPSSVTIPAGATSANFTIRTTSAFSITTVTITATYNGVSRSAQLTIWF